MKMMNSVRTNLFVEGSQITIYNLQKEPASVVVIAIGLVGTEQSPYFADLVTNLQQSSLILGVRGLETSSHTSDHKFFLKNDCSRITRVMAWVYAMYPETPKIGIGISLGGALILRHQSLNEFPFDEIVMASTSLWYDHAVRTMPESFMGRLANKVLTWWQFERLYFGDNYLTTVRRPTTRQWLRLLLANNLLQQDKVLCELYGIDYTEYITDLDMRRMTKEVRNVNYLISTKDPMFSKSHLKVTLDALAGSLFKYDVVDFGGHGDFTLGTSNDYLVNYCEKVISRVWAAKGVAILTLLE
jgi:predicted alpha/beta-fold hydrolase